MSLSLLAFLSFSAIYFSEKSIIISPEVSPIQISTKQNLPSDEYSVAGRIRLHTDAASITPEANPDSNAEIPLLSFLKGAKAISEPAVVPTSGNKAPIKTFIYKKITPVLFYAEVIFMLLFKFINTF